MSQEKIYQVRADSSMQWWEVPQANQERMVNNCGWQGRVLFTEPAQAQPVADAAPAQARPVEWTEGPNAWKDWCTQYFGPDADDAYLADAVFNLPLMGQRFKNSVAPQHLALAVHLLQQVIRPYGIYDVAVSHAGAIALEFIDTGKQIRALAAKPDKPADVGGVVGDFHVVYSDDSAVDLFAAAMKKKMAESRAKGRDGWYDPDRCPAERLQQMLRDHLAKGDPVDVANFCMMLFNRDLPTAALAAQTAAPESDYRKGFSDGAKLVETVIGERDAARAQLARQTAAPGDSNDLTETQWRELCWESIRQHHMLPDGIEQRIKASVLAAPQPVDGAAGVKPELTVWEGAMPESNGRSNFTAVLHRKDDKDFDLFTNGFQFERSEYPDRVKYEADFMRWLIGERETKPELWDDCYDMDKHSGYTAAPAPAAPVDLSDAQIDAIADTAHPDGTAMRHSLRKFARALLAAAGKPC